MRVCCSSAEAHEGVRLLLTVVVAHWASAFGRWASHCLLPPGWRTPAAVAVAERLASAFSQSVWRREPSRWLPEAAVVVGVQPWRTATGTHATFINSLPHER